MAKSNRTFEILNFPIDFIPMIINNPQKTLVEECIYYGMAYCINSIGKNLNESSIEYVRRLFNILMTNKEAAEIKMNEIWSKYNRKNRPHTHISLNKLWHYAKMYSTEEELAALALLLAMRSINRDGRETHSTIDMLCARMNGLTEPLKNNELNINYCNKEKFIAKWMRNPRNRRKLQKMLAETENIEFHKGHSRGIKWRVNKEKQPLNNK